MTEVKLILKPKVTLIARTVPTINLVDKLQPEASDLVVQLNPEFGGRACYQSWDRPNPATATNSGYIRNILSQRHFSVLEHSSASFYIEGVSRALTHELVRHRHFSYCLAGDTEVYLDRANRGQGKVGHGKSQTRTLEQLWDMWQDRRRTYVKTCTIRTVNDQGVVVHDHIREIVQSGIKPVYRVTTASGYQVKSTRDHLFQLPDGQFSRLGDLSVGSKLMVNGTSLLHDRDWVTQQVEAGRSTAEIAALLGVAPVTVRKWRRKHGCPADLGSGTVGRQPWNKGKAGTYNLPGHSEETKALLSAQKLGELNPAWKGGPESWSNGRAAAVSLWGNLRAEGCVYCGEEWNGSEGQRSNIELHHIDGDTANNARENIAVVCVPCHKARHTGTPPMKTYVDEIVSIEYVGEEMTYDIEMAGPFARFVANGFVVHNSQLSQRYVDSNNVAFVVPPALEDAEDGALIPFAEACKHSLRVYSTLEQHLRESGLKKKQAREAARSVLPNSTETKIEVTGNLRAWLEFLVKRDNPAADAEIQRLAKEISRQLAILAPDIFGPEARQLWDDSYAQREARA